MRVWCVKHEDGWCAVKSGEEPPEAVNSVETKCGMFVILPGGAERRKPTCDECIEVLRQDVLRDFPFFKSEYIAVFNCNEADRRKGYVAVRKQFGESGVKVVKRINKTGCMAMYQVEPTPETEMFSRVVGMASDKRRMIAKEQGK